MIGIEKLSVFALLDGNEIEVGELILSKGKIYFRLDFNNWF